MLCSKAHTRSNKFRSQEIVLKSTNSKVTSFTEDMQVSRNINLDDPSSRHQYRATTR